MAVETLTESNLQVHIASSVTTLGPLPIGIAITGHRDILADQDETLEHIIEETFRGIQGRYPHTPLLCLSALAEGADRIGARVALRLGIKLIVPLPMSQVIYESDFDEESKEVFRSLLQRAEHYFELPLAGNSSVDEIVTSGSARDDQYAQLGAYIATHSQIVIALWDGVQSHHRGGTSQVVRYKLEGVPEPFAPPHSELDAPESGPVYHIVTPRQSNPHLEAPSYSLHKLFPAGFSTREEAEQAYADILERMDIFNQDALKLHGELQEKREQSKHYVFPDTLQNQIPQSLRDTLNFYSIADTLSQFYQRSTHRTLKILLAAVFGAALFYDLYSHFFEETTVVLVLYLAAFFFAFGWFQRAEKSGSQTKYLDYRALAEGLRVQFFWQLAQLPDSVADYYLRKQKSELDWIRNAVRICMTETSGDTSEQSRIHLPSQERLRHILRFWVDDQAKYFAKAAHRDHRALHQNEKIVNLLFGAAILCALVQVFIPPFKPIIMAIGLLPIIGALLHTFAEKRALSEHTKQYDRMSVLYHRAKVHLQTLIDEQRSEEAHHFIGELGREALAENGDWILTHRERPLEVPKGA